MKMNIATYNKLKKYDSYFNSAYYSNYMRGMCITDVEYLSEVAKEVDIHYNHNGCPACLLNFIKKLAYPYMEMKKKIEDKKKAEKENKEKNNNKESK